LIPLGGTDLLVRLARWPILIVLVAFALAVLYRFGPSRTAARWLWTTGQCVRYRCLDRRPGLVLVVRRAFPQLQQDIRLARRDHGLHDLGLDLDLARHHPRRRQARRRNRAPPVAALVLLLERGVRSSHCLDDVDHSSEPERVSI